MFSYYFQHCCAASTKGRYNLCICTNICFVSVCIPHGDCFAECGKWNDASSTWPQIIHASRSLKHSHSTLSGYSATRCDHCSINVLDKPCFHILFDIAALPFRTVVRLTRLCFCCSVACDYRTETVLRIAVSEMVPHYCRSWFFMRYVFPDNTIFHCLYILRCVVKRFDSGR